MEGLTDTDRSITASDYSDFSFAYNNCSFSDRILRLKITTDLQAQKHKEDDGAPQSMVQKAVNMAQESFSSVIVSDVRDIHINSLLLAKKSQFFCKLFSNGMQETMRKEVDVQIACSEEHAFMDLLKFMYSGALTTMSTKESLDVMILADRFEVMSYIHQCATALRGQPMSNQSASIILSLPRGLIITDVMQPLYKAAKEQLLSHFGDNGLYEEQYMNLPINVIEELLSSDELTVPSEDYIYDFVMQWAKQHYTKEDERREVLRKHLVKLIRFPRLTSSKLSQILLLKDSHFANVLELISEAFLFKAGNSYLPSNLTGSRFRKRSYELVTPKVFELHTLPTAYNVHVYCEFNAYKSQRSEPFYMLGKKFSLVSLYTCRSNWNDEYRSWELYVESMDDEEFSLQCRSSIRAGLWRNNEYNHKLDFGRGKKLVYQDVMSGRAKKLIHEDVMNGSYVFDKVVYLLLRVKELSD